MESASRVNPRFGLAIGLLLWSLVGCQGLLPREVDPASREYDPAPFSLWMEEEGIDEEGEEEPPAWPNAQSPGPDLANFPNSAFTVPKNAFQIEFAPVGLSGPTDDTGPNLTTDYLLRYGLTDRLELRLFGPGYIAIFDGSQRTTGFGPLGFDLKMNFWDESKNHLIPAVGMEVFIESTFASPAFSSGIQPGIALLIDHTLPWDINFEWNVGINGAQAQPDGDKNGPINSVSGKESNTFEWSYQWAFQRQFFKKLDVFTHGFINSSTIPSLGDGIVVGAGAIYQLQPHRSIFGSYNAGLNRNAPTTYFQLGFSQAF